MQRAKRYKLQIERDAANLLTDYVEGNLSAATQALEKIYLMQSQQPIDAKLIVSVFTDESRFTIFDFAEHFFLGEHARTLHILDNLKADGAEPVLILWALTRELRLLAGFSQQVQRGAAIENVLQTNRIFFRRQTAFRRFLTRASYTDCWHLLKEAAFIDRIIKGAARGNCWDALRLFCFRMV